MITFQFNPILLAIHATPRAQLSGTKEKLDEQQQEESIICKP